MSSYSIVEHLVASLDAQKDCPGQAMNEVMTPFQQ
jgi:hypothetical protein